jgi:hypothetical protein
MLCGNWMNRPGRITWCSGRVCDMTSELATRQGIMTTDVGLAIQAAIERGEAHRAMSQGQLVVRLFSYPQGLAIVVTVPARDYAEADAIKCGMRVILRSDLTRRAHELPDLVVCDRG